MLDSVYVEEGKEEPSNQLPPDVCVRGQDAIADSHDSSPYYQPGLDLTAPRAI